MKQLFWFLLFGNVAFLVWNYTHSGPEVATDSATPAVRDNDKPLVLLSEREAMGGRPDLGEKEHVGDAPKISPPTQQAQNQLPPRQDGHSCYIVGPYPGNDEAAGAVMQLKEKELLAKVRKQDSKVPKGYWVFVPPLPSREEARQVLRNMHQQNVDSFIVTKGDKLNSISVGIYGDLATAQARRDELASKGFSIQVEERSSTAIEYWVEVDADPARNVVADIEKGLATDFAGKRLERTSCK